MEYLWYLCAFGAIAGVVVGVETFKVNGLWRWVIGTSIMLAVLLYDAWLLFPYPVVLIFAFPFGLFLVFLLGIIFGWLLCIANFAFGKWSF